MFVPKKIECLSVVLLTVTALTSCVDDKLDLNKDFDMTVTLGENKLTVPTSSTAEFTLEHILNIKENSSIKAVSADGEYGLKEGDYVLIQSGSPTQSSVKINPVSLSGLTGSTETTELPVFSSANAEVSTGVITNRMVITDDNVTDEVIKLKEATTDIELEAYVSYESANYNGTATLKPGFEIRFDNDWTIEPVSSFLESVSSNVLRVKAGAAPSFSKSSPLVMKFKISKFKLNPDATLAGADGLYATGHFKLQGDAKFEGKVAISSSSMSNGVAHLTLKTVTKIPTAKLTSVVGRVNPKINVNPTTFNISGVPDAFSSEDNNLDLSNPQFYLTVTNGSPVKVNLNAVLTPYGADGSIIRDANGQPISVGIGELNGTAPIVIPANVTDYVICVSRTGQAGQAGAQDVVTVPTLSNLMLKIPDKISVEFDVKADSKNYYTIVLGQSYAVNSGYEAVIPLSFGENMHFSYETQDDGWDEDLEDYNFNQVTLTTSVVSTVPLKMTPVVHALDKQGNEINDVEVVIEGSAAPGSLDNPVTSELKAVIKSNAQNIKNLDGVKVSFTADADASTAGQTLNKRQSVKFNNIKVTVTGGVTIDLN